MIVNELLNPKNIVVVGGSNDIEKPGGKVLLNLIDGHFLGEIYVVNPKEEVVQEMKCFHDCKELPNVELAIIAVAAKYVPEIINVLAHQKGTKAFIVLSAGFSEMGEEGRKLEQQIVSIVESVGGSLIGPNCIGVLTTNYKGVFAGSIPKLDPKGCDFVSGSGATVVFVLEIAIPRGLTFSSIFSVGNSAQIGVEDVLEFWDNTFDEMTSSKIKLIYVEQIYNPSKFLKHSRSLINKGCRIAAIKAGTTEAGSRAVSSHTGALAGSDTVVSALFKKAGIVRCFSRVELVYMAGVFVHKRLQGDRIAVITHAGGSGVMLTDTLSRGGLKVPQISGIASEELLSKLYHGSSVSNPIDFLATGTAEQLGIILDYVDNDFDNIDGSAVIFGTTGMFDVSGVYDVLDEKMRTCKKPIFPILPSVVQAAKAVEHFLSLGRINFTDEVTLGKALSKAYFTKQPSVAEELPQVNIAKIREVIDNSNDGYLDPKSVEILLDAVGISRAEEKVVNNTNDALLFAEKFGFPLVMKVVGPIHKTDVGGVVLNVSSENTIKIEFERLMGIKDATSVLVQKMHSGIELFAGAKYEPDFGHIIVCGLGGVFIEVMKDISYGLAPISTNEALLMMKELKSYKLIQGVRGKEGIKESVFADKIVRLSALVQYAPEIIEMDINPFLGKLDIVIAVDARIKIEKNKQ
jgi:acyl-CoA synthetase (NDP forming)